MRPNVRFVRRGGSAAVLAITLALLASACSSSGSGSSAGNGNSNSNSGSSGALTPITYAGPSAPNGIAAQMAYGQQEGIFKKYGFDLKIMYPANTATAAIIPDIANGT